VRDGDRGAPVAQAHPDALEDGGEAAVGPGGGLGALAERAPDLLVAAGRLAGPPFSGRLVV
jgi:hypothetical protein